MNTEVGVGGGGKGLCIYLGRGGGLVGILPLRLLKQEGLKNEAMSQGQRNSCAHPRLYNNDNLANVC